MIELLRSRRAASLVTVIVLAVFGAACGGGTDTADEAAAGTEPASGTSVESGAADASEEASGSTGSDLTAMLPADIQDAGVLRVASNTEYPPFEYFDEDGQTIIGLDKDLADALGERLGVQLEFENMSFDSIIPALEAERYDMAMSAMTDNEERRQKVDFVDYFVSGGGFMVAAGNPEGLTTLDDLCGVSAAIDKGTTEVADAEEQSAKCEAEGKEPIDMQVYPGTPEIVLALQNGRADVAMIDTSAAEYIAGQNEGKFEVPGESYAPRRYGIVLPKGSDELADALVAALDELLEDGTYADILGEWGQELGAVDEITINDGEGLS